MVGQAPERPLCREIKTGILVKRSQNRRFITKENYQTRLFVLDTHTLRYFKGTEKDRGEEKGVVDLSTLKVVEAVEDGLLPGQKHALQVIYTDDLDQSTDLYIVTPNQQAKDDWITAIRTEAHRIGAHLQEFYHRGVSVEGIYNCCGKAPGMTGCTEASVGNKPDVPDQGWLELPSSD